MIWVAEYLIGRVAKVLGLLTWDNRLIWGESTCR
jgi:hypothetical protein